MANVIIPNLAGPVWSIVRTASSPTAALPFTIWSSGGAGLGAGPFALKNIQWQSKTPTAGDTVTLTDTAGNLIWEDFAPATTAYQSPFIDMADGAPIFGLILTALDSGILTLTLR